MLGYILKNMLERPDAKYRGIPFWSWNDRLDPDELRWQIKQMREAGLGGYFMHARAGLRTPYMDEEWMKCVSACVDEGDLQGLQSWIYDENGYPSGFAAGKLPAMGVEYQQKFLKFEIIRGEEAADGPGTLGFYRTDGDYGRINPDDAEGGESVLHAYYEVNPFYADLLDEAVVRKFIEMTHDVYYEKFKEHFGKGIPGIFTDEPQYGRTAMPWSFALPGKFTEKNGYDIIDYLSAFCFKIPDYRKIRYDFWNVVAEMFTGAVSRQLAQWCEGHECKLTGHVLLEEDIRLQTMCSGSAMGFYRYMQIPGIDWLGRGIGDPVIIKQASSVGEQLGKEQILSEMFAAAGWGASLEELKRIAEWQYSMGVNVICAHLEGYSLRGLRKRDHPPGLFYQTNWWKDYSKFNDYFARLGMLLSEGRKEAGVLVLHPLRSGWIAFDESCCRNGANAELAHIDGSFAQLSKILSGLHLDYHYGDEKIIAEFGSQRDGAFIVGNCSYRVVLIPPAITLEPDTARLLTEFIENGGKVFAFEDFPFMIKGVEAEELRLLKKSCGMLRLKPRDIGEKLEKAGCRVISVLDGNSLEIGAILHKICHYGDDSVIFLVNTDEKEAFTAEISLNRTGACYAIDLEKCGISQLPAAETQNSLKLSLCFTPCQSYVIAVTAEPLRDIAEGAGAAEGGFPPPAHGAPGLSKNIRTLRLADTWKIKVCGLNAMTLDYCQVAIGNGGWSERKPVLAVQRKLLGMGRSMDIALRYAFDSKCSFGSDREMYLVIEEAHKYVLEVNGKPAPATAEGWWKDKSFHKVNIRGMLKKGLNTVLLRTHFYNSQETINKIARARAFEAEMNMLSFESEIESIYLLGEFTVAGEGEYIPSAGKTLIRQEGFQLDEPVELRRGGELTVCGYPFFSGSALFEQEIELKAVESFGSIIFKMDRPNCALSRLQVNGLEVKTFLWAPYEAEIRPYVREGVNNIALELVSTDRNLFGPHHHPRGELYKLGPLQFTDIEGWKDSYCFIRFGPEGEPFIQCFEK